MSVTWAEGNIFTERRMPPTWASHLSVGVVDTQGHGNDTHAPLVTVIADMGIQGEIVVISS